MSEIHIVPNDDDFERNEVTVIMEPPPRWHTDEQWASMAASIARCVTPVTVEQDTLPLESELYARLFPRRPFLNQG